MNTRLMNRLPLKTIPLPSLVVGMYITKLEIPWMDSPFLNHNRVIKSQKDIDQLKKAGVTAVIVDPNKYDDASITLAGKQKSTVEPSADKEPSASSASSTSHDSSGQTKSKASAAAKGKSLDAEVSKALKLRDAVRKALTSTLESLSAGNAIDKKQLAPLIDQTLESLERNNQALLNLAHFSYRTQKLADHAFSTCCIALNLAQNLNVPPNDIESLGVAALLHEAGWAQIPIQLMGKRKTYSQIEKLLVHKHCELGVKALSKCEVSDLTQRIVAEHHELCNGKGYPNKLSAEKIHPLSKLFSVVDRYDELVHQLTDQPGMITTNALRSLYSDAQEHIYDQASVAQLISLLGVYPISSAIKLSNGAVGVVREVSVSCPLLPLVEIHVDEKGNLLDTPFFIDLAAGNETKNPITVKSVIDPLIPTDLIHKRLILNV